MGMNAWEQYKGFSETDIVQSLLQEQIYLQSRHREKISFRCVAKKRIRTSLFWGIPTLFLLLDFLMAGPLERDFGGAIWIIVLAMIWMHRVRKVSNENAARYMVHDATSRQHLPFDQIVSEDMQQTRAGFFGSKVLHTLLCLAVMVGCVAISVADYQGEMREAGMIFRDYKDGCILEDCVEDFSTAHVVIPERVQGKTVIAIHSGAFADEEDIVSVRIPDTVASIGGEAFSGCTKLESITIPRSVTQIRGNCFEGCSSLKQVVLHEDIVSIHGYAFRNCSSLEQIDLPSGITEIRGNCFENCTSLKCIEIPDGVTRIAAHAFMGCSSLESATVPSTVREIGSSAFRQCPKLETIEIPRKATVNERAFKESPTKITYKD